MLCVHTSMRAERTYSHVGRMAQPPTHWIGCARPEVPWPPIPAKRLSRLAHHACRSLWRMCSFNVDPSILRNALFFFSGGLDCETCPRFPAMPPKKKRRTEGSDLWNACVAPVLCLYYACTALHADSDSDTDFDPLGEFYGRPPQLASISVPLSVQPTSKTNCARCCQRITEGTLRLKYGDQCDPPSARPTRGRPSQQCTFLDSSVVA